MVSLYHPFHFDFFSRSYVRIFYLHKSKEGKEIYATALLYEQFVRHAFAKGIYSLLLAIYLESKTSPL